LVVLLKNLVSLTLVRFRSLLLLLLLFSVGPTSASILDSIALEYLIDRVRLGIYGYNQLKSFDFDDRNITSKYTLVLKIVLFALIALEKFSHTSESKHILLQSLTINNEQSKINILEYYEPWASSNNCLKRQIGRRKIFENFFSLNFFSKDFMLNGYLIMYLCLIIVDQHMR
jgi:hypothetical protein